MHIGNQKSKIELFWQTNLFFQFHVSVFQFLYFLIPDFYDQFQAFYFLW